MRERTKLLAFLVVFAAAWWAPAESPRVKGAILESVGMLHEYTREHVLLCLVPAFFIAGAVSVFVNQASVLAHLGAGAPKRIAYPVASVSGTVLAVCSCTVLPLFSGIYTRGAGLGPATAFLYAGPAINILAIVLTARVLGIGMGVARAVGAVGFSFLIGLIMHALFRREEEARTRAIMAAMKPAPPSRRLWQEGVYFGAMVGVLVFANWPRPGAGDVPLWSAIFQGKWILSAVLAAVTVFALRRWFHREEMRAWVEATWLLAKQILPLLLAGVLVAGLLLGRPGREGLVPSRWVSELVGGNSLAANFFAALVGAFMYFATITEVPILQSLLGAGMGGGPGLALLLAGPALSLPAMIVIRGVLGLRKTIVYVSLVVLLSTTAGLLYGALFAPR